MNPLHQETREIDGMTVKKMPHTTNEHGTTCDECVLSKAACGGTIDSADAFWHCFTDGTIFVEVINA